MKFPTIKEMAEEVAEKALDEFEYKGKTLREWIEIISASEHGTNLASLGTDCISRQAAIDALCDEYCGGHQDCKYYPNCENLRSVQKLPSAQPAEPKRGRWILDRSGAYCCSKCMEPCAGYVMMKPRDKFCKMCGSRNEVTE